MLFIAGDPTHGFGNHEHPGGSKLLADTLNRADIHIQAMLDEANNRITGAN